MRSYNLGENERLKEILLSYTDVRKVYLEDIDKINLLFKEDISNDENHLYTYNKEVKFCITSLKIENNKIVDMTVYLLSNNSEEMDNIYFKIRDEKYFTIENLSYIYKFKEEKNSFKYFLDNNIGIIKNFEKCFFHPNIMLSDIEHLGKNITKLELKNGYYYLNDNQYLSEDDFNKYANQFCCEENGKNLYVVLRHIGSYDTIYKTYDKLLKLIKDENRKIIGLPMEQFVCGRWNESDENKYITNIMIPIAMV